MKTDAKRTDSLFTNRARGGVIGGSGYNFQDAYVITALPGWLGEPAFHSFIKEGFEDVDVRFEDATGTCTWHYQLKNHEVGAPEFRQVLGRFRELAGHSDLRPKRFILACAGLAVRLVSLWQLVQEYRGARRTYSESELDFSRRDLEARIDQLELGEFADLIIDQVDLEHEIPRLRDGNHIDLMERFRGRFIQLPHFHGEPPEVLDRLFLQLAFRVNKAVRVGLTRSEIELMVKEELASATIGQATVVYLHGWARQTYDVPPDVEVDWTKHFDHATLLVPRPDVWDKELTPELERLRLRLDEDGHRRSILLRSRAPLSAGLAFGHTFAEAAGYNITVQQPSPGVPGGMQHWGTDSLPDAAEPLEASEVEGDPNAQEVAVAVGVTDDIRARVEKYLGQAAFPIRATLYLYPKGGPSPVSVNEENVTWLAASIKRSVRRFADQHQASLVHLFYYGPLGLAVLLGQKLNGLPDIQCYERDKVAGYRPTCRLPG